MFSVYALLRGPSREHSWGNNQQLRRPPCPGKKEDENNDNKHCQGHNGPKALSTLTLSTPLVQCRSFNINIV